jgi:hypothetical protein
MNGGAEAAGEQLVVEDSDSSADVEQSIRPHPRQVQQAEKPPGRARRPPSVVPAELVPGPSRREMVIDSAGAAGLGH